MVEEVGFKICRLKILISGVRTRVIKGTFLHLSQGMSNILRKVSVTVIFSLAKKYGNLLGARTDQAIMNKRMGSLMYYPSEDCSTEFGVGSPKELATFEFNVDACQLSYKDQTIFLDLVFDFFSNKLGIQMEEIYEMRRVGNRKKSIRFAAECQYGLCETFKGGSRLEID